MLWAIYSGVWTATHKHIKLVPDGNKSNKLFKKDLHISLHCIVLTGIGTMGFSPQSILNVQREKLINSKYKSLTLEKDVTFYHLSESSCLPYRTIK